jgi:hypothetical protein
MNNLSPNGVYTIGESFFNDDNFELLINTPCDVYDFAEDKDF